MLEILAYVCIGLAGGVFTGLIPSIHVNNLTPILVGIALSSNSSPIYMCVAIVAMMMTHTIISYIPSTFLGAPEEGTALSVLPAHKLLLEGRGYEAIRLTAFGCLGALILSAGLILPLNLFLNKTYEIIQPQMHWILISVVAIMIALEKSLTGILCAMAIFLLSGLLGILALDASLLQGETALMPLLSGLFGISVLLTSIMQKSSIPKQDVDENSPIEFRSKVKALITGTGAGILTGIIPGIGPSQGTVLTQIVTRSEDSRDFLIAVSGVNMSKALFSFVALMAIGKPRSGAAVAVGELIKVGPEELVILVGSALVASGLAAIVHLKLGKIAAKHMGKLPYRKMCVAVIASIVVLSAYLCGIVGIVVLFTATAIGLLPAATRVRRTHCMGCIILPCILFFAGLKGAVLSLLGL